MAREIAKSIRPTVEAMGYEFVGAEYLRQAGRNTLRVYIDAPDGITVDDCGQVSHQLSGVLDLEDPIREAYDLEVSSPGMDRPLFKEQDYQRFVGQRVKIKLAVPDHNRRRNFAGTLLGIDQGKVRVKVENEVYELVYEQIERARLVPQF